MKNRSYFEEFPDLDERMFNKDDIDLLLKFYVDKRIRYQISFYEARIRENQRNSDFTFNLGTAIMTLSSLLATISATVTASESSLVNIFPIFSAVLPALAALLAAFRQLYGWERQILIYRDSLLGLERARLLMPDDDRVSRTDLMAIFPKLVASAETVFNGEASQWGQFVLRKPDEDETQAFDDALSKLGLTEEQVKALRAIAASGQGQGEITISAETLATSILSQRSERAALHAGDVTEAGDVADADEIYEETVQTHTVSEVSLHMGGEVETPAETPVSDAPMLNMAMDAAPVMDIPADDFVDLDGDGIPDEPVLMDDEPLKDGTGIDDPSGVVDMTGFAAAIPPGDFVDLDGDGIPDEPVLMDDEPLKDGIGVEDHSGVVDMSGFEAPIPIAATRTKKGLAASGMGEVLVTEDDLGGDPTSAG